MEKMAYMMKTLVDPSVRSPNLAGCVSETDVEILCRKEAQRSKSKEGEFSSTNSVSMFPNVYQADQDLRRIIATFPSPPVETHFLK